VRERHRLSQGSPDDAAGQPFTSLKRFVMELFRVITPNGGSISALTEVRTPPFERHGYVATPHATTSFDPVQWKDPDSFNPDRYNEAPRLGVGSPWRTL
jgi:cytochrome P450